MLLANLSKLGKKRVFTEIILFCPFLSPPPPPPCFVLVWFFSPLDSQHTMQAGLKSLGSSHLPECLPVESIELVSTPLVFSCCRVGLTVCFSSSQWKVQRYEAGFLPTWPL